MNQLLRVSALAMSLVISSAWAQRGDSKHADCKTPETQKAINECAYDDFLAANAGYAESNKLVMDSLQGKSRDLFRRAQKSWIAYRTASCAFESSAAHGGSAQGMVNWQCAARMTRARVAEMNVMGNCLEGDVACVRFKT